MLLRSLTGPFSLANKTEEGLSYKNLFIRPGLTAGSPPERLNMGERMCVSSVSLFQNTRGGTIIPSRALLLLLVACYHDQNHTHYWVELIEVVVRGRRR